VGRAALIAVLWPDSRSVPGSYRRAMRRPLLRSLLIATGVLAGTLGFASPSSAMVRADPDPDHVAVGSFWASVHGGQPFFLCTGTLLSEVVFVTAGHCVDYVVKNDLDAYVSFQQDFSGGGLPADLALADAQLNPRYKESNGTDLYQFDVSVLTLRSPHPLASGKYGVLPPLGYLDQLKAAGTLRQQRFALSGYGTSAKVIDHSSGKGSPVTFPDTNQREVGILGFSALAKSVLHEDQRASAGYAGAGYGDSGGPSFIEGTNMIVGVTSTGDIPCYSTNTAYRLDTAEARDFLGHWIALP
jgi:hypothetical protein